MNVVSNEDPSKIKEINDKNMMEIINGVEGEVIKKIPAKESSKPKGVPDTNSLVGSTEKDVMEQINLSEGKVVKKIGKSEATKEISSRKKLVAKKSSETSAKKAKEVATARKKASEARRAKNKEK